jgi:two-component system, chemotaxis family, sensor kinase CheA
MVVELNQYLSMFIDEANDHLQAMNENLLALEASPQDISIVQSIFRSAHTLKGMSATMGFEDLAKLTHEAENVLDLVRNNKLQMNAYIFDAMFKSLDALELMVGDIIQGGTGKADVTEIVSILKSIVTGDYEKGQASKPAATAAAQGPMVLDQFQFSVMMHSAESGHQVMYVEVSVREDCVLKAARAYMVFNVLEQNGEVVKASPSVEDIEQEKFDRVFSVYYITKLHITELEKQIASISEIEKVSISQIDSETLEQMMKATGEAAAASAPVLEKAPSVSSAPPEGASASNVSVRENSTAATAKPAAQASGQAVANRTIRVDIERLDALMNLFSELLIDRVRLESLASEIKRSELTETVERMARTSSDLQNIVMKLRMVPVDSVFNRFPRMVRDLAKSLDKKLELVIIGADTELDRTVIDEIGDPLVHLLRNSVDHGLETVQERIAAGKPEVGTVWLRAYHSGNHVFIEVEEDGRGISRDRVLNTAIKKGVISPERGAALSDKEVYELLFASGFSTADKISDISGRGVGLDVVKSKIQSLGGNVTVDSKYGAGTKFSVQLPLTLSIIAAMLIRLGNEKYAIPLSSIVETSAIRRSSIHTVTGKRMVEYRKSVIPLVSLSSMLDVPNCRDEDREDLEIVVIRKGDKLAALIVDEFIGQQEIVLRSLGKYLSQCFALSGATILGDGQVALIIDTNGLIK